MNKNSNIEIYICRLCGQECSIEEFDWDFGLCQSCMSKKDSTGGKDEKKEE
jgi:hypothetical protein